MKMRIKKIEFNPTFVNVGVIGEFKTCEHMKAKDFTLPELLDLSQHFDPLTNERSKKVIGNGVKLLMMNKDLDLVFHVRSAQPGGPLYTQLLRFYDIYKKKLDLKEIGSPKTLSKMLKTCEVGVWCSDPSFQYWGPANNATRGDYNIITEVRTPNEPNKKRKEEFVICKHLIAALKYVEENWDYVIENYWRFLSAQNKVREKDE